MEILPRFLRRPAFWVVLAAIFLLYVLAGFLGVPRLVRMLATDTVREDYGRELGLGDVRFNPFTLVLEVDQVVLPDAKPATRPAVALDKLRVDLELRSLWRRGLVLREIAIDGLAVSAIIRSGGDLNLLDFETAPEAETEPTTDEGLPYVHIGTLSLASGAIHFEDRDRPEPFVANVSPLAFTLTDFSTQPQTETTLGGNVYRFDARVFDSVQLAWRGTVQAEPLASDGQLAIEGLPLTTLATYLGDALPPEITGGVATLRGTYRYASGESEDEIRLGNGNLEITNLGLRVRGEATDAVTLPDVKLAGINADAGTKEVVVGSLVVAGGSVNAKLSADGTLNLEALAGTEATSAAPPTEAAPADSAPVVQVVTPTDDQAESDWQARILSLVVQGLTVTTEDQSVQPAATLRWSPVNLTATGYGTAPGTTAELDLDATLETGGRIQTTASVQLDDFTTQATVTAEGVDLQAAQPYLESSTGITLKSGLLGMKAEVKYREEKAESIVDLTGDVTVDRFRAVDDALKEDFAKWDRLELRSLDYRGQPERLKIREVVARSPYVRVIIGPDGTTNLATALSPPGTVVPPPKTVAEAEARDEKGADKERSGRKKGESKPPPEPKPPAEPVTPFPVSVTTVRIENGSTNFADFSTTPRFATGIEKLSGRVTGLSSNPKSRAKVTLDGQVDRFSPVTIRGEVNPLSAESYLDLAMTFRNVELANFTPYSGRFAGYTIRKGKMSVDLNYKVENRQLNAKHKFVIDQLELGEKVESAEATSLPLKLAVALLKDRNGVIDLDLPVTGDLDDPQFRVGPIIWKVFVNLITKAATAPFALLGSLFGGGEDVNILDFRPGQATLDDAQKEQVANLTKALTERPGLELNIPAVYSPDLDRSALVEQELERRLLARSKEPSATLDTLATDQDDYLKLLKAEFRATAGRDKPLPAVAPAADVENGSAEEDEAALIGALEQGIKDQIQIPDPELTGLATRRAQAVQAALLTETGIDPTRVFLTAPEVGKTEGGVVVMELSLR